MYSILSHFLYFLFLDAEPAKRNFGFIHRNSNIIHNVNRSYTNTHDCQPKENPQKKYKKSAKINTLNFIYIHLLFSDFLFLFVFFHEKLEVEHLYQLYKSGIWTKSQKGLYYIYIHTMELCNIHIYYGITVTNTSDNLAFWQRTFYLYLHTHNLLTASRLLLITNPLPLTGFLS